MKLLVSLPYLLATCLILLIAPCSMIGQASAVELSVMTHSAGDQGYIDNKGFLRGKQHAGRRAFYIELVREMMQELDVVSPIEEVPLKRALFLLSSEPGYALFNLNRTAGREAKMKWVGPLHSSVTHFYENKNAPTGIQSFDDAQKVESICVLRENVHHRLLRKKGFTNIFPANSYVSCIHMLSMQRVKLTPLSNLSSIVLNKERLLSSGLQKTAVKLSESQGYIAFSKSTPGEVIDRWQAALDKLKESGRYQQLIELYLHTK